MNLTSVALKLRSDGNAGRKLRIQPHQVVQVGRTEWADFVVNDDPHMAPVHFRLASDHEACHLQDLGSDGGTLLNGRPVTTCVLSSGDVITAGSTQFEVLIERSGHQPGSTQKVIQPAQSRTALPSDFRFEPAFVGPGIQVLRGPANGGAPLDLMRLVANRCPAHMLIDFARAGVPTPTGVEKWPDLLARLPEPLRAGRSIRSVPFAPDTCQLFDQVWGKDAAICLFSKGDSLQG